MTSASEGAGQDTQWKIGRRRHVTLRGENNKVKPQPAAGRSSDVFMIHMKKKKKKGAGGEGRAGEGGKLEAGGAAVTVMLSRLLRCVMTEVLKSGGKPGREEDIGGGGC